MGSIIDKGQATKEIQDYKNNELYKVNDANSEFRAIVDRSGNDGRGKDGGFARDLFFDSVRCSYYTGSVKYRDAHEFGLKGWEGDNTYADILGEPDRPYIEKVKELLTSLENLTIISINPGWEKRIRDFKEGLHR